VSSQAEAMTLNDISKQKECFLIS